MEGGKYSLNGRRRLAAVARRNLMKHAHLVKEISAVLFISPAAISRRLPLFPTITESTSFQAEPKP